MLIRKSLVLLVVSFLLLPRGTMAFLSFPDIPETKPTIPSQPEKPGTPPFPGEEEATPTPTSTPTPTPTPTLTPTPTPAAEGITIVPTPTPTLVPEGAPTRAVPTPTRAPAAKVEAVGGVEEKAAEGEVLGLAAASGYGYLEVLVMSLGLIWIFLGLKILLATKSLKEVFYTTGY